VKRARLKEGLQRLPLYFIENRGQRDERVAYFAQQGGSDLYFTSEEAVMVLPGRVVRTRFVGGDPDVRITGADEQEARFSYFSGNESDAWLKDVRSYGEVTYHDLYPGVDLTYSGQNGALKYGFVLRPGADVQAIRLAYAGVEGLRLAENGDLLVTPEGASTPLRDVSPTVSQEIDGELVTVGAAFKLYDDHTYGFRVGEYDPAYPLVIDPQLSYATFLGGSGDDYGYAVALNDEGNVYLTGHTYSSDLPTTSGAYDETYAGGAGDVFVSVFDATLSTLLHSTFLGGNGWQAAYDIELDDAGNAYVMGYTEDPFPTTSGAYDTSHNGNLDVFVSVLDGSLSTLSYSTLLGGLSWDVGYDVTVDDGRVYVTGGTGSSNFPTSAGAYDRGHSGWRDAFVSVLDATLSTLSYSTLLGGSSRDEGRSVVLDGAGNVYVLAFTEGSDYPSTSGSYDASHNGGRDAVVSVLDPTLSTLTHSTFLGASGSEYGSTVALDGDGNVYVVGRTASSTFPTTPGAYDETYSGGSHDVFASVLDAALSTLSYSTFLGGTGDDHGCDLVLGGGRAYLAGYTSSSDFPTTSGAYDEHHNGRVDAFASVLNPTLSDLPYSTLIGTGEDDYGDAIALDDAGFLYVVGRTEGSAFPTTDGAYDTSHNGSSDVFASVLETGAAPLFSISGHVRDGDGTTVHGVTVSTIWGGSATTDTDGSYALTDLPLGTYNVVPSKSGYTFSPTSQAVTVPPGASGVDFVATEIPDGEVSTPDSDGDGLSDDEETSGWDNESGHFLTDPQAADTDGDGVDDGTEKKAGTNPTVDDTDDDGLTDGDEDQNQNGSIDRHETDPLAEDTDGDGVPDGDDPVPMIVDNRKALVIWMTEFKKQWFVLWTDFEPLALPRAETENPARHFEILGFDVTAYFDKPNDGQLFTYDQVDNWTEDFSETIDESDIAVVFIATHGDDWGRRYYMVYGDGLYAEARRGPWPNHKTVRKQLKQIGPGLEFLWLRTCHSYSFKDEINGLGAEGIIFFGATDKARPGGPEYGFYKGIAGADAGTVSPGYLPLTDWEDYYDSSKADRYVEDVLDDVNETTRPEFRVWEKEDNRAGKMDLLDPNLSRGATADGLASRSDQLATESPSVTPTLYLTNVTYLPYDSDLDGLDDALEITWAAGTDEAQQEAMADVQVYDGAGDLRKQYLVGPYTVTSADLTTTTVTYLSAISHTYEAAIELYALPHVLAGVSRSSETALRRGPDEGDGDEALVDVSLSHGQDLQATFTLSTTAAAETVSVVGRIDTDAQTLGGITSTVRSPEYAVARGAPATGTLSLTPPATGTYSVDLYLTDQHHYVEDAACLHPWATGVYTESVLDRDGDDRYDALVIDVGLMPPQQAEYVLSGQLYDADGNHVTGASVTATLPAVTTSLPITLPGTSISRSGHDGPYQLRSLSLSRTDGGGVDRVSNAYWTDAYDARQFDIEGALLTGAYHDRPLDPDGDGYVDRLEIDVGVMCAAPNTYTLSASLTVTGGLRVGHHVTSTVLATGESTMTLSFDGRSLRAQGVDGPYALTNLTLRDAEGGLADRREKAHWTGAYDAERFQEPEARLTGSYADHGLDTDGDGLYDYLAIDVGVEVNTPGQYRVEGTISSTVPYTIPWVSSVMSTSTGIHTTTLAFDGRTIGHSQAGGSFVLDYGSVLDEASGRLLDRGHQLFTTTQTYTYTQFQACPVEAVFTASATSGIEPLTVDFANQSIGDYADSLWDLGDGVTETVTNPTHTYTRTGVHTVTLTVAGLGGTDTMTRSGYITACHRADVVCDCLVDVADIQTAAEHWRCEPGGCYDGTYDVNDDGRIDIVDIMLIAAHWGCGCGDGCYEAGVSASGAGEAVGASSGL
jgi:hypothetical protein